MLSSGPIKTHPCVEGKGTGRGEVLERRDGYDLGGREGVISTTG